MKWFDVNLAIATFVNNYFDDTACLRICASKHYKKQVRCDFWHNGEFLFIRTREKIEIYKCRQCQDVEFLPETIAFYTLILENKFGLLHK